MIFSEVYGDYYNTVAAILKEAVNGNLDKKRITEIVTKKAFDESLMTIPDALISGKWHLIDEEYKTPIINEPTMPLSTLQKMWLKGIMTDPRIQLFEPSMDGLEDITPLFDETTFVYFDRYNNGDPYKDEHYRDCFRTILKSVKSGNAINVTFKARERNITECIVPNKLEYSVKDDKFRVLGTTSEGINIIVNVAAVIECEDIHSEIKKTAAPDFAKASVTLLLKDDRNALERAMLHFSDLEKETVKLDDKRYRIKLKYRQIDETEILIRILAFGPLIKVIEPEEFQNRIKERIFKQKSCE